MMWAPKPSPPKPVTHVADMESTEWVTLCGLDLLDVAPVANHKADGTCNDCKLAR